MHSSSSIGESTNKYDFEYQTKIEKDFEYVKQIQELYNKQLDSFLNELSTNDILDLIKEIYQLKIKSERILKRRNLIQEKFQEKQFELNYLENEIEKLKKDLENFKLKFEEITNDYHQRISNINQTEIPPNNQSETIKSNSSLTKRKSSFRSRVNSFKKSVRQKPNDTPTLSHLILKQISPSILDINLPTIQQNNETLLEEEEQSEIIVFIDFNSISKIDQKIRLDNNIVRVLKGPFKVMVDGTMHVVDVCARGTHISDDALKAVQQGLEKQKTINNNSTKATFAQITSDWKYQGENSDRGYSSPSLWMTNPQGQRILIKTHEHPLSAANEWLAFVLGRLIALPVNEIQISTYQNQLVTLHTDVKGENEKVMTFMDLPKEKRKTLLTTPIMACMDLFDQIIQNVDRNPRNILITMENTININDDNDILKVHFIDHSNCFGMGKLNGISLVASKFHTNHLAVVKFDPIQKSKQFEKYLTKLTIQDRTLISKTLNKFASITDEQFDTWINQIRDLLSDSQYNRIHGVLRRQRDIAKRYTIQWGIYLLSFNQKSIETNEETNDTTSYS
jgi:hypothetical protein